MTFEAMRKISGRVLAACVLTVSIAACVSAAPVRVYVHIGPPAPIVEARAVAPGPGYVWIAGYHRWDGAAYVWVPGRWDHPPRAHARWVAGRWSHGGRGWYYTEGHWR